MCACVYVFVCACWCISIVYDFHIYLALWFPDILTMLLMRGRRLKEDMDAAPGESRRLLDNAVNLQAPLLPKDRSGGRRSAGWVSQQNREDVGFR